MPEDVREVVIIGSGPGGHTAAIYLARGQLSPLVITGGQPGGQLTTTSEVENYPGFPEGINGMDLVDKMQKQAKKFGAEYILDEVKQVDLGQTPFKVTCGREIKTKALIVCTGSSPNKLGLTSEEKLWGRGVSACATCDGFFYREKVVAVVGGGDVAIEEAMFLTQFATKVYLIHRRDEFRASRIMQEKLQENTKVEPVLSFVVEDILDPDQGEVKGLLVKNLKTQETSNLDVDGLFVAIGHRPNTGFFQGQLELDKKGYIVTKPGGFTNIPGVFAAGDVQDPVYQQAITAAGSGCQAALNCEKYLLNY